MKICLSILPVSEGKVLVATYNSGIFLYDYINGVIDENWVDRAVNERISGIYCGVKLSSGEFALGTLGSGIYVLDSNGKLVGCWDTEKTELQDNIIYALYVDPDVNSELWISTTGYITKAYTNIPFTRFGSQSGINGGVNGISELDGTIYVSTDDGVIKSQIDKDGARFFEKVEEISGQVFPIFRADIGKESFILAGSQNGLFQILKNGKVINVKDAIKFRRRDEGSFFNIRYISQSKLNPNQFYIGLGADVQKPDGLTTFGRLNRDYRIEFKNKHLTPE